MNQFIACMCDSDFSKLVVTGLPTAEQILEAWQNLFFEYCDLIETNEDDFVAFLQMRLDARKKHLHIVLGWLRILKHYKSRQIAAAVELLYPVKFDFENDISYNRAVAEVEADLRSLSFDTKVKDAELKAMIDSQTTKKDTIDRKYFATVIMRMNNYLKMNPPINGLTKVEDYCTALRDYVAAISNTEKR